VLGRNGTDSEGIDIKAYHCYVVGPGVEREDGRYEIENDVEIADLPPEFAEMWQRKENVQLNSQIALPDYVDDDWSINRATAMLKEAEAAVEGQENGLILDLAHKCCDIGVSPERAADLLIDHWLPEKGCNATPEEIRGIANRVPDHRQKAIGCDHVAEAFEVVEVEGQTDSAGGINSKTDSAGGLSSKGPRFVWGDELERDALRSDNPLIDGVIEQGTVSLWYGASNAGKSFVVATAADAIAAGEPWAGRKTARGAVCYFAGEGGRGLKQRILALRRENNRPANHPLFLFAAAGEVLGGSADVARMVADIKAAEHAGGVPCRLAVIDTTARAFAGDENTAADMGRFIRCVDLVRKQTGAHVLLIHHTGKDQMRGARGHSSLLAAVDSEFEVIKGDVVDGLAGGTIRNTKQRDMEATPGFQFRLRRVVLSEEVSSAVADVAPQAIVVRKPLTDSETAYLMTLEIAQGEDANPWIAQAAWEEVANGDGAKSRQYHAKFRTALMKKGHVERQGEPAANGQPSGYEYRLASTT
jgi:hypothetical protein